MTRSASFEGSPDIHAQLAEVARQLSEETTLRATLDRSVELAMSLFSEADGASAAVLDPPEERYFWTHQDMGQCHLLQHELGVGPMFDLADEPLVSATDLRNETRWADWSARAVNEFGVRSILCLRLFTASNQLGTLSLFSQRPHAFLFVNEEAAITFAAIMSSAVQAARTTEQLREAVEARTVIGQAQGVIMERLHVDAKQAFDMLKQISQNANVRVQELAHQTIAAYEHPDRATRNPRQYQL